MQTVIATLDAGLYGSIVTLLGVLQPGTQARRAYNAPEINALLEGEAVSLAFLDANMIGFGEQFSAQDLADRHPDTRFFVLGAAAGLRLETVAAHGAVAALPPRMPAAFMMPATMAATVAAGGYNHSAAELAAFDDGADVIFADDGPALTGRQADVLRLVREGKATKEIARQLGLAVPTVKTHLAALYRQLGVRNRVEAAMKQSQPATSGVVRAFPTLRAAEPARVPMVANGLRVVG